jgi:hypothetical protein
MATKPRVEKRRGNRIPGYQRGKSCRELHVRQGRCKGSSGEVNVERSKREGAWA